MTKRGAQGKGGDCKNRVTSKYLFICFVTNRLCGAQSACHAQLEDSQMYYFTPVEKQEAQRS